MKVRIRKKNPAPASSYWLSYCENCKGARVSQTWNAAMAETKRHLAEHSDDNGAWRCCACGYNAQALQLNGEPW